MLLKWPPFVYIALSLTHLSCHSVEGSGLTEPIQIVRSCSCYMDNLRLYSSMTKKGGNRNIRHRERMCPIFVSLSILHKSFRALPSMPHNVVNEWRCLLEGLALFSLSLLLRVTTVATKIFRYSGACILEPP